MKQQAHSDFKYISVYIQSNPSLEHCKACAYDIYLEVLLLGCLFYRNVKIIQVIKLLVWIQHRRLSTEEYAICW